MEQESKQSEELEANNNPKKKPNHSKYKYKKKKDTTHKYIKRGPGKQALKHVTIFSANCAGCSNKVKSLVNNVNHLEAGLFTLQETHFKRKGRLNSHFSEFEIFEAIRKKAKRRHTIWSS